MAEQKAEQKTKQKDLPELFINSDFINGLSKQLEEKQKFGLSFPPNYNISNALNSAYLEIKGAKDKNSKSVLSVCTKDSIANALVDMAVQGLNPAKKQCYFVPYGNKLVLMRSYHGTKAVARRVGVKTIFSEVVYKGDSFSYEIRDGIKTVIEHKQDFKNIGGEILGAYAIIKTDDITYTEVMNIDQIKAAWNMGAMSGNSPAHKNFGDQMAKKTVEQRACKSFINTSDDGYLVDAFENTKSDDESDVVAESAAHEVEQNANSVEFEELDNPESVNVESEAEEADGIPDFAKE